MPNEIAIINQPDSIPGAVSTGYTRQNVINEAIRNGIDRTVPYGSDTDEVTLPVGGPVDVNGVLYSITTPATLSGIAADTDYYIYLDGSGDTLTPTLTTDPGTFDASKNARYTAGGYRILNWVLRGDGVSNVVCMRMINPREEEWLQDQDLRKISAVTFASLNTGQGDNELYDMNQNVKTSDSPTFADIDISDDFIVGDDLTIGGNILPMISPVTGSITLAPTDIYYLSRGLWNIFLDETADPYNPLEIWGYISGSWWPMARPWYDEVTGMGVFAGDGDIVRIRNSDFNVSVSCTFRYQRY